MRNIQSETINELATALVKAQAKIHHAIKDRQNPHFKNDYATLESVIDATKSSLAEQGLVIAQQTVDEERGFILVTTLMHASGQWLRSFTPILNEKNNAQGMGSGLSYARRYALAAICNISQTDDDGNDASARKPIEPQAKGPIKAAGPGPMPKLAPPVPKQPEAPKPISNRARILQVAAERRWKSNEIRSIAMTRYEKASAGELTEDELEELCDIMAKHTPEDALKIAQAEREALARRLDVPGLENATEAFLRATEPQWDEAMHEDN